MVLYSSQGDSSLGNSSKTTSSNSFNKGLNSAGIVAAVCRDDNVLGLNGDPPLPAPIRGGFGRKLVGFGVQDCNSIRFRFWLLMSRPTPLHFPLIYIIFGKFFIQKLNGKVSRGGTCVSNRFWVQITLGLYVAFFYF